METTTYLNPLNLATIKEIRHDWEAFGFKVETGIVKYYGFPSELELIVMIFNPAKELLLTAYIPLGDKQEYIAKEVKCSLGIGHEEVFFNKNDAIKKSGVSRNSCMLGIDSIDFGALRETLLDMKNQEIVINAHVMFSTILGFSGGYYVDGEYVKLKGSGTTFYGRKKPLITKFDSKDIFKIK